MRIVTILLAAGASRRYGKRNKLLETVDGLPLVRRTAQTLQAAGMEEIVVVVGFEAERVEAVLDGLNCKIVVNPNFGDGMGHSLAVGVQSLQSSNWDGILVCLSDLPLLDPATVRSVCEAFQSSDCSRICVPSYQGMRGHPVCFPKRCASLLADLAGDRGAKQVIRSDPFSVVEVVQATSGCVQDLDTPERSES